MAKELTPIDIGEVPELLSIAQRVRETGQSCVLKRADEELAIISPVKSARRGRKTGVMNKDDSLWSIVGSAVDADPSDAAQKHTYLGEALGIRHA